MVSKVLGYPRRGNIARLMYGWGNFIGEIFILISEHAGSKLENLNILNINETLPVTFVKKQ